VVWKRCFGDNNHGLEARFLSQLPKQLLCGTICDRQDGSTSGDFPAGANHLGFSLHHALQLIFSRPKFQVSHLNLSKTE
jgi:hypothetical protein